MSARMKQEKMEEPFQYSWHLPVSGMGGIARTAQAPGVQPEEPQEAAASGPPMAVQTASEEYARPAEGTGMSLHIALSRRTLALGGIGAWTIAAAGGSIAMVAAHPSVPLTSLLAVGGVWAALSALIWFLPPKFAV